MRRLRIPDRSQQTCLCPRLSRLARTLSVPVRGCGRPDFCAHGHMADRVSHEDRCHPHIGRSEDVYLCPGKRFVKPSAQPTLVRTQHLPPPAKTTRSLRKRGPAGRFLLVTPRVRVDHYGSMHGSVHVHMVYSVRAKLAVRITARFRDLLAAGHGEDTDQQVKAGRLRVRGSAADRTRARASGPASGWDKETCPTPAGPEGLLRGPARASALCGVLSPNWPRSPHHGPAARRARRRSMPPW